MFLDYINEHNCCFVLFLSYIFNANLIPNDLNIISYLYFIKIKKN